MTKKDTGVRAKTKPMLIITKAEIADSIQNRIEIGRSILAKPINSQFDFDNLCQEKDKWHRYNVDLLQHSFERDEIATEYKNANAINLTINPSLSERVMYLRRQIEGLISLLESILERLPLYAESASVAYLSSNQIVNNSNTVFIVHGHDEELKHEVARFVTSVGLKPIILSEQVSQGATIISKFKKHAAEAAFAIVLLTPDDVGYPKNNPEMEKPRARQNAILELGYFLRALDDKNVVALVSGDVELPSDYQGVVYIRVDKEWQLKLAKEMRAAGLDVDLNRLLIPS